MSDQYNRPEIYRRKAFGILIVLFHFFIQEADRAAYSSKLAASLAPEGRALRLLLYDLNDLSLERFEWLILC
jgi:hypothetical protein